jgi:ribosomal protein S12 methylthiotransferase
MADAPGAPSVAFLTLGCPKNEVDTDRMRAAVANSAFSVARDAGDADVLVVNTCSFIEAATEESVETVLEAAVDWAPERPGRRLVVAGCMPSRYGSELSTAMPEVDAFVPVAEEGTLLQVLERLTGFSARTESSPPASQRTSRAASAYLQVSDGCHRSCAYCTIPAIRGPYRSRPLTELVVEAQELVALGAREIVLIGQDITAWGRDLEGDDSLAQVVDVIARVPGVDWLRLMYAQPDGITDELLAVMAAHGNVCHYLDMPLQHASSRILKAMKRRGSATAFLHLIERIRTAMPDAVLRTTLIAGFPGETRSDAQELERFLRDARFDYVGVFVYSAEDGTAAALMTDQVPLRTRRARAQRLRDIADDIGFERVASRVGQELEVLVEGIDADEGVVVGRWRGQAPEIDGLVLLDHGSAREMVRAEIVDALGYDLEGEVRA